MKALQTLANAKRFFIVRPDRVQLNEIARLIDTGQLRPLVDRVFPLSLARQAFKHKAARGKAVLNVADSGVVVEI